INTAAEYVCREWIDEVCVAYPDGESCPEELLEKLIETGVTLHTKIATVQDTRGRREIVERLGNYTVLTTTMNYASTRQLVYKRILDIIGGLCGCIFTLILTIILGPIIYIKSPGPIFFSQVRVGRNGRKFKIYKFRSMYLDAEERKKELLDQNKSEDGLMFKMDFDPRVIGNKLLPDGTKKTGIGDFIRRTSLDEFPQFFNVLKGEMSLVGTRPPTVDEWEQYELHHRARLATKPGITGMWQVSGRSNITDFEEVVKLDTDYINEWSIGTDIKILLKTVKIVLSGEGSM
ncbi:MAG: sugar transferase, partial [Coprococcus sp.]